MEVKSGSEEPANRRNLAMRALGKYYVREAETEEEYREAVKLRRKGFIATGICGKDELKKPYDDLWQNPNHHIICVYEFHGEGQRSLIGTGEFILRRRGGLGEIGKLPIESRVFLHMGDRLTLNEMADAGLFEDKGEKIRKADAQFRHFGVHPSIFALSGNKARVAGICNHVLAYAFYTSIKKGIENAVMISDPRFSRIYNGAYSANIIWPIEDLALRGDTGKVLLYPEDGENGWRPTDIMFCEMDDFERNFPGLKEAILNNYFKDFNDILRKLAA